MTADRERAFVYAAGLTLAVGVLAGVLGRMTVLVPMDAATSTVEARVAGALVVGALLVVAALYVLVPFVVAAVRSRDDGHPLRQAGIAIVAVLGVPLSFLAAMAAVEFWATPGHVVPFLVGVAATALLLAGLVAAATLDRLPPMLDRQTSVWPVALNLLVVVLFAVGFLAVQPFAGGFADGHTDTYGGSGGPHAHFNVSVERVDDDRAIVTFTHAGGDPLGADDVAVRGEGFAEVDGADHAGPGAWQGTVSGELPRRGGPAVVYGDSVSVGVTGECEVGIVYDGADTGSVITWYDCQEPQTDA